MMFPFTHPAAVAVETAVDAFTGEEAVSDAVDVPEPEAIRWKEHVDVTGPDRFALLWLEFIAMHHAQRRVQSEKLFDQGALAAVVGTFDDNHVVTSCLSVIPRQPRIPLRFDPARVDRSASARANHDIEKGLFRAPRVSSHHSSKMR